MAIIEELYNQDQQDRNSRKWEQATAEENLWLKTRDKFRKDKVYYLYKRGKIKSPLDYNQAALILHHGNSSEDYKTAHLFAKKAVKGGDTTALWLYAATLDRWLISIGKPQKFGTQMRITNRGRLELILPINPTTTNIERSRYKVPPLPRNLRVVRKNL